MNISSGIALAAAALLVWFILRVIRGNGSTPAGTPPVTPPGGTTPPPTPPGNQHPWYYWGGKNVFREYIMGPFLGFLALYLFVPLAVSFTSKKLAWGLISDGGWATCSLLCGLGFIFFMYRSRGIKLEDSKDPNLKMRMDQTKWATKVGFTCIVVGALFFFGSDWSIQTAKDKTNGPIALVADPNASAATTAPAVHTPVDPSKLPKKLPVQGYDEIIIRPKAGLYTDFNLRTSSKVLQESGCTDDDEFRTHYDQHLGLEDPSDTAIMYKDGMIDDTHMVLFRQGMRHADLTGVKTLKWTTDGDKTVVVRVWYTLKK